MESNEQARRMVEYLRAHCKQHLWECSFCVDHVRYCDTMRTLLQLHVKWTRRSLEVTSA